MIEWVDAGKSIVIACNLNIAQACLNLKDWSGAIDKAGKVLKDEPNNVKALYRRGIARNNLGSSDEALVDLKRALELEPSNASVKLEMAKSKKTIAEANKKTKAAYSGLFNKISVYEDKAAPVLGMSKNNPKVSCLSLIVSSLISLFTTSNMVTLVFTLNRICTD